jgi:hypothetical protein
LRATRIGASGSRRFTGQIKIDDGVARIAHDDEPMMFDASAALIVGHMNLGLSADNRALTRPRQAEKKEAGLKTSLIDYRSPE